MSGARVALIGLGEVGRLLVAPLLARGHTIVAAVGRRTAVGKHLGELCGIPALDLIVRNDLGAALRESRAELALIATGSTLAATAVELEACIGAGCAVITAAEEAIAPWAFSPERADRLHAMAVAHQVAVLPSGHVDALWVHLPLALTGVATEVSRLEGEAFRPLMVTRAANAAVVKLLGRAAHEYPVSRSTAPGPGAAHQSLHAIAAAMHLRVTSAESSLGPALAPHPIVTDYGAGVHRIETGTIAGTRLTVRLHTAEGVSLTLHDTALLGSQSSEHWRVSGTPNIECTLSTDAGLLSTATQMVARIGDALTVSPGLYSLAQLPPLRHRAGLPL